MESGWSSESIIRFRADIPERTRVPMMAAQAINPVLLAQISEINGEIDVAIKSAARAILPITLKVG